MTDYSKNNLMKFINHKPGKIEICDVTLRDGEQTPGVAFTTQEKITIIMATHDPVSEEYAHIVYELVDGQVTDIRYPNGNKNNRNDSL